ncbi:MAG TPA: quinol:electron acceptor oxidoreductase subunit ActD [Bryobacteraceae bacterium]
MAEKNLAVFGIYANRNAIDEAVSHLGAAGFRNTDVSSLLPENPGSKDLAHEKNTKALEGSALGGVLGLIVGAALGWLIASGVIPVPGVGPLLAAGPIIAALAGAGTLGAVGGIIGGLIGLGIPEYEAKRFGGRVRDGGMLISVHCDNRDWVKRAKEILTRTGAQEIGVEGEKRGDFANTDKPLPRTAATPERPAPRVRRAGDTTAVADEELYAEQERPATSDQTRKL